MVTGLTARRTRSSKSVEDGAWAETHISAAKRASIKSLKKEKTRTDSTETQSQNLNGHFEKLDQSDKNIPKSKVLDVSKFKSLNGHNQTIPKVLNRPNQHTKNSKISNRSFQADDSNFVLPNHGPEIDSYPSSPKRRKMNTSSSIKVQNFNSKSDLDDTLDFMTEVIKKKVFCYEKLPKVESCIVEKKDEFYLDYLSNASSAISNNVNSFLSSQFENSSSVKELNNLTAQNQKLEQDFQNLIESNAELDFLMEDDD